MPDKKTKYENFLELYDKRFGRNGPSISAIPRFHWIRLNHKDCGCWKCDYERLKKGIL